MLALAPLVLGFVFVLMVLVVLVVVGVVLAVTRPPVLVSSAEVAQATRHQLVTSVLAVGAFLLAPPTVLVLVTLSRLGGGVVLLACFPLIAAVAAGLVMLLGELTWPRPEGATRVAVLNDRSIRAVLAGRWAKVYAGALGVLVVVGVLGGLLADGYTTSFTVSVGPGATQGASPFPGWPIVAPQLVAAVLSTMVVGLVVWAATRRSSVLSTDRGTDLVLRRASAARVFRAATVGVLLTVFGDLVAGAATAGRVVEAAWQRDLVWVVLLLALVSGIGALAALLVPVPRPIQPVGVQLPPPHNTAHHAA